MRNKRRLLLLSVVAIPAIGLTVVFAQPGSRGDRGSRGGDPSQGGQPRMRGNFDPTQMAPMLFSRYSGGQDTLDVNTWIQQSSQRDPNAADNINKFLQAQGITSGRVNLAQYTVYLQQRMSGMTPGGPSSPGGPGAPSDDARLRERFNSIDKNNDGVLQPAEVRAAADQSGREGERWTPLRDEFEKWDKDHNGLIDFDEFKEYYNARRQAYADQNGNNGRRGPNGGAGEDGQPPTEDKHVVYRRDEDLPKDLPPWFRQIKRPIPGQIAFRDWKAAGGTLDDFRKYDRNSDGFITVEEVMSVEKKSRSSSNQRGGQGGQDADEPREEQTFVIAGPGAVSDDAVLAALPGDGNPSGFRGPQGGSNGFGRGNSQRGGPPSGGNMGNFGKGGTPGGDPRTSRGGPPGAGSDPRSSRGGPPSGNTDPRSNRGNRPGRGNEE